MIKKELNEKIQDLFFDYDRLSSSGQETLKELDKTKGIKEIKEKIRDLFFDYDRMSTSGQKTYKEIINLLRTMKK